MWKIEIWVQFSRSWRTDRTLPLRHLCTVVIPAPGIDLRPQYRRTAAPNGPLRARVFGTITYPVSPTHRLEKVRRMLLIIHIYEG